MESMSPRQLDRLRNAVIYFAGTTRFCGWAKLFRLLYLLDVAHFQHTGQTVTGERYAAYEFGPAPVYLYDNWGQIMRNELYSVSDASIDFNERCYQARRPLDPRHFTRRQHFLMNALAQKYRDSQYKEVSLSGDNSAWVKTWKHGAGKGNLIPYELTVSPNNPSAAMVLESQKEEEMRVDAHRFLLQHPGGHAA